MAAPSTVRVFNVLRQQDGTPLVNANVHLILDYNQATVTATGDDIIDLQQSATTDATGTYTFTVVPTDLMSPSNLTYTVVEPNRTYQIAPLSTGGASQQTTAAGVIVNQPGALVAATQNVTGPLTVQGALVAQSTLQSQGVARLDADAQFHGPDPWYDVKHPTFGADSTGASDATTAINNAITAATATGGIVYLPPGTYKISGTLNLSANVRLMGAGRDFTTLLADDVAGSVILAQRLPAASVNLGANLNIGDRTVTLTAGGGASFAAGYAVLLSDTTAGFNASGQWVSIVQSVATDVLTLQEASPIALTTGNGGRAQAWAAGLMPGISVTDLTVTVSTGGTYTPAATRDLLIRFNGCDAPTLQRVRVSKGLSSNVRIDPGRDAYVFEVVSEVVGATGDAFDLLQTTGASVVQCSSRFAPFGIVATQSPFTRIIGCRVTGRPGSNGRGIKLQEQCPESVVANNVIADSTLYGILINDSWSCNVIGNHIFSTGLGAGQNGIHVDGNSATSAGSHHTVVEGNTIRNIPNIGILIGFGSGGTPTTETFIVVRGNTITGVLGGIQFQSSRNLIEGNSLDAYGASGGVAGIAGCLNNAIIGNVIKNGNTANAIQTPANGKSVVIGNSCEGETLVLDATDYVMQHMFNGSNSATDLRLGTAGAFAGIHFRTAGADRWTINNNGNLTPETAMDNSLDFGTQTTARVRNAFFSGGVALKVKAGVPVDGDFVQPTDGMICVDSTDNKIFVRIGGTWKGVVVA